MRIKPPTTQLVALMFVLCLAAPVLFDGGAAFAQAGKPITKDGLIKAVKINGLSTQELVQQIRTRGVAFKMTPSIEAEMRAAGRAPRSD